MADKLLGETVIVIDLEGYDIAEGAYSFFVGLRPAEAGLEALQRISFSGTSTAYCFLKLAERIKALPPEPLYSSGKRLFNPAGLPWQWRNRRRFKRSQRKR